MAERPEPLNEVLPLAKTVVVAEVVALIGESVTASEAPPRYLPVGAAPPLPEQKVKLKISRTLKGTPTAELVVVKPSAPYVLAVGHHGPFLLDGAQPSPQILGRYGPDTFRLASIEHALSGGSQR